MQQAYRLAGALLGWTALAMQYYLVATHPRGTAGLYPEPVPLAVRTVNFLSFFTIESNFLVALALTLPVLAPRSALGRWLARPGVRSAVALYIAITGVIYALLLRHLWNPQGLNYVADTLLHVVMPIWYLVDWLTFVPRRSLAWRNIAAWMAFPVCYALYTLVHGAAFGFYPYPFVNVARFGYPQVLLNILALTLVFCGIAAALVAINRYRPALQTAYR